MAPEWQMRISRTMKVSEKVKKGKIVLGHGIPRVQSSKHCQFVVSVASKYYSLVAVVVV